MIPDGGATTRRWLPTATPHRISRRHSSLLSSTVFDVYRAEEAMSAASCAGPVLASDALLVLSTDSGDRRSFNAAPVARAGRTLRPAHRTLTVTDCSIPKSACSGATASVWKIGRAHSSTTSRQRWSLLRPTSFRHGWRAAADGSIADTPEVRLKCSAATVNGATRFLSSRQPVTDHGKDSKRGKTWLSFRTLTALDTLHCPGNARWPAICWNQSSQRRSPPPDPR